MLELTPELKGRNMAKEIYLTLNCEPENGSDGIATMGFDIVWSEPTLVFVDAENLGVFDMVNADLQDGVQGRLVVGAAMTEGQVEGGGNFIKIKFEFTDEHKKDVDFSVENVSAQSGDGDMVELINNVINYEAPDIWFIDWAWE